MGAGEPRTIRALLIDLDGVVRRWDPENNARAERLAGLPPGALGRAAFARDLLLPAITGRVSDEEWRRQIVARLRAEHPAADAEEAVARWSASPGAIDHATLELARACRRQMPVVLVTNATSRLDRDLARLGLAGEFDHIVNSSTIGWIKPQQQIFAHALDLAGAPATHALFVDDSRENVVAALQLGIAGHCYQDAAALRDELARHKLL